MRAGFSPQPKHHADISKFRWVAFEFLLIAQTHTFRDTDPKRVPVYARVELHFPRGRES
jgi:hypothetical protein